MNNYVPVVMVVGLNGCRSMFAASEHSYLREEIGKNIPYPEFARDLHLEGIVNVNFATDSRGNVTVSNSTASHPDLLEYVTKRLSRIIIGDDESKETQIKLMLKFIMY